MDRTVYPRPPIVEAVLDFRLRASVPRGELIAALVARLGDAYPGDQAQRERVQLTAQLQEQAVSTRVERRADATFLRSADNQRQVACGDSQISLHALAPYPGWAAFLEQARYAIAALPDAARSGGLASVAVRYIDHIELPSSEVAFNDYFTVMPKRPEGFPSQAQGFHVALQSVDERGVVAQLILASIPSPNADRPSVLYDLCLQRTGDPVCDLTSSEWEQVAEELHARQKDIFENSITEATRDLFR